jgi:membrane-associated phospholipid phosphatase
MNILKFFWARPRWRHFYSQYEAGQTEYFKPWYILSCNGHFSDTYASFPSGHTMNALCWIVFAGASSFLSGLKGKEWIIRLFVYVWAVLVAMSRTIMGAHFPSDTTAGFLIELLLFDLMGHFFYPWFHAKLSPQGEKNENPIKTPAKE